MWQYTAFTMMQGLMSRLFEQWRATQFETCLHRRTIKKWATQMGFYVHSARECLGRLHVKADEKGINEIGINRIGIDDRGVFF